MERGGHTPIVWRDCWAVSGVRKGLFVTVNVCSSRDRCQSSTRRQERGSLPRAEKQTSAKAWVRLRLLRPTDRQERSRCQANGPPASDDNKTRWEAREDHQENRWQKRLPQTGLVSFSGSGMSLPIRASTRLYSPSGPVAPPSAPHRLSRSTGSKSPRHPHRLDDFAIHPMHLVPKPAVLPIQAPSTPAQTPLGGDGERAAVPVDAFLVVAEQTVLRLATYTYTSTSFIKVRRAREGMGERCHTPSYKASPAPRPGENTSPAP